MKRTYKKITEKSETYFSYSVCCFSYQSYEFRDNLKKKKEENGPFLTLSARFLSVWAVGKAMCILHITPKTQTRFE